jgi:hypothetical protein
MVPISGLMSAVFWHARGYIRKYFYFPAKNCAPDANSIRPMCALLWRVSEHVQTRDR